MNEENNCVAIIDQDPSEESKDTDGEIEECCETELEGSGSDTVSSEGQDSYNGVNEPEQVKMPLGSTLVLGRFLKKRIPTLFGLQKPSIEFQRDEMKRATKGFTKDSNNMESIVLVKEIRTFPIEFKRDELWRATKGFAKQIGQGGFGNVYYGILSDGKRVAIKMLNKGSVVQGKIEWMNELRTLSKLHHRNITELVGYCFEDSMLIFEYIPRDVRKTILEENEMIIDWPARLKIILDITRALTYLHEGADVCILHRDIKPSNILRDEHFNAKICDFGLARMMQSDHFQYCNMEVSTNDLLFLKDATEFSSHETLTRVAGTYGYMAPEYAMHRQISTKSDIYSFGITLLEIVSGKRSIDPARDDMLLTEHAWRLHEEDRLHELIDPRLLSIDGLISSSSISRTVKIGLWCTAAISARRPSASRVLTMLLSEEEIPNINREDQPFSRFCSSDTSGESSELGHISGGFHEN